MTAVVNWTFVRHGKPETKIVLISHQLVWSNPARDYQVIFKCHETRNQKENVEFLTVALARELSAAAWVCSRRPSNREGCLTGFLASRLHIRYAFFTSSVLDTPDTHLQD